ncbi:WD40 repeat-like protein [Piromyces finnis]|uniref:WD40 repeat-like protein n=1 Tax=Piromyces finnis TaxID=1754191 RepID=A0A1Y1VNM3_9FUNG|nr:WD40 repeat-like protein [Piromyces finnis]|eukprot:ORX61009.1 WD40 repeat-like protein [Piromyces finnis]
MADNITCNAVTPVNKSLKKKYSTSSFSKGKRKYDAISSEEIKLNSSPFSASSNSSLFSPTRLSTIEFIEYNENVSPTPKNILSNKKIKKSQQGNESISNKTSNNLVNLNKKKSKTNVSNNSINNILTPYKKTNSTKRRRRSSIGLCITSSPTTPYNKNSPQNYTPLRSPSYSIRRRSITSSSKKNLFYSPCKYSPKRLFSSPVKFKSIRSPKVSKYGNKKINDTSLSNWNLNCSPIMQRIKHKVKAVYGDRFIPNRHLIDFSSTQLNLVRKNIKENEKLTNSGLPSYTNIIYQENLAQALSINFDQRILTFNAEPPATDKPPLRSCWNKSLKSVSSFARRRIPTQAERVLDAPGIGDDYYTNLLDWSSKNIVAIALDSKIYLWNANNGDVNVICEDTSKVGGDVCSISWTQDGKYLGVGTSEGDTQIWDVEQDRKLRSMYGHITRVGVLSWDKYILSSGCRDGSIYQHDVRIEKHKTQELLGHCAEVCGLSWKNDGQLLASGGNDNLVNIWDIRSSLPKMTKTNHRAAVKALAWCPWQSNILATGGGTSDKTIHFWNTTTETKINSIFTGSQVTSLIWSLDYKEILSSHGFPNNNITLWKYPTMDRIINIQAHDARVLFSAISPDGQSVATAAGDETLKFWKIWKNKEYRNEASSSTGNLNKENENTSKISENDMLMSTFTDRNKIR